MRLKFKAVFISDTHLGTSTAMADKLLAFIKNIECEVLYLVGDIIDLQRLKHRFYWPTLHNDVVRSIMKMASKGTKVYYIPGNHDDRLRQYVGLDFGGIRVKAYAVHTNSTGKKLLVTHGDQYDLVVMNSPYLAFIGTIAYDLLIILNRAYNRCSRYLGLKELSLSQKIKLKVKVACKFIGNFEKLLAKQARHMGVQGVICGHIHRAEINKTEYEGIEYYNCGDWVESGTALCENEAGEIEILDFKQANEICSALSEHSVSTESPQQSPWEMFDELYRNSLRALTLIN